MRKIAKSIVSLAIICAAMMGICVPSFAAGIYAPGVTEEMLDYNYWAELSGKPDELIMTKEQIKKLNDDTAKANGTMIIDLKTAKDTFNGVDKNDAVQKSATADAKYYFGWTYTDKGEKATWDYYKEMIDNCYDPDARFSQDVKYGIAVNRTVIQTFPSDKPIWDDVEDVDFDYQALSSVRVNEPMLIYTTSRDGKYYLARINCVSGWVKVEDVAICKNKEEWLSAWDIPENEMLLIYGDKIYTDTSISSPETSKRMLTMGTTLKIIDPSTIDGTIINRSPYHNYVVELPVRTKSGGYDKVLAYIPEKASVHVGYLPLTRRNIAMVAFESLGDAYGWGGMLDNEDCSNLVRINYECFGIHFARNITWQWNMNIPKIDISSMTAEEKNNVFDSLEIGSVISFPGHEMMYLGKVGDKHYVISSVGSVCYITGSESEEIKKVRIRGVIINDLDMHRANAHTWAEDAAKILTPQFGLCEYGIYSFTAAE